MERERKIEQGLAGEMCSEVGAARCCRKPMVSRFGTNFQMSLGIPFCWF